MNEEQRSWTLVIRQETGEATYFSLSKPQTKIGRDSSNDIVLADDFVSKQHAVIHVEGGEIFVRDLNSHNGCRVNGVGRHIAKLELGDRLEIGPYTFFLQSTPPSGAKAWVNQSPRQGKTLDEPIEYPTDSSGRRLGPLFNVCFWITEGVEESTFVQRCLRLLVEAFQVREVHYYSDNLRLDYLFLKEDEAPESVSKPKRENPKPSLKLGEFLAGEFQKIKEANSISGIQIARHQRGVDGFNYLVGPLRPPESTVMKSPFLVLLRPAGWDDFTVEDRVLLQAICRLWVRNQDRAQMVKRLAQENRILREQKAVKAILLGKSEVMNKLRARARKIADSNATILLRGETGSGKEELARFIHENSPRQNGPFCWLNCAAIPKTLIESELFGYVEGAFFGADKARDGRFVRAHSGTLLLDEIGDLPLSAQTKILRAIENKEVQPLGTDEIKVVDVRIIAATNRDLEAMAKKGQFREDLLYRLDIMPLRVPPLREHLDDLEELVDHFVESICSEEGRAIVSFTPEAINALKQHPWRGNVRELRSCVYWCIINAQEPPRITDGDVLGWLRKDTY